MTARWELGSLFDLAPWPVDAGADPGRRPWDEHDRRLTGTGRGALALALAGGGFRRVWVPSYLCQEVVTSIEDAGIPVARYADSPVDAEPGLAELALAAGDAVLIVSYFGVRRRQGASAAAAARGAAVIEDHTHAPCSAWALASTADYCVASLRKLLPIADGGVVWSPRGRALPPEPPVAAALAQAAATKLEGMVLKRLYLDGQAVDKVALRRLLAAGEAGLYAGTASGMTALSRAVLGAAPIGAWDRRRAACFAAFAAALPELPGVRLVRPEHADDVPFSALLELDTPARRDRVLQRCCERGVYPSTLWPLDVPGDDLPPAHRTLARRLLSVPIDMRYAPDDLVRAAGVVVASSG